MGDSQWSQSKGKAGAGRGGGMVSSSTTIPCEAEALSGALLKVNSQHLCYEDFMGKPFLQTRLYEFYKD